MNHQEYQHYLKKCELQPAFFKKLPVQLQEDIFFVQQAIELNPFVLLHTSTSMQNQRDLVLQAIDEEPQILQFLDEKFLSDELIISQAVKKRGQALKYASRTIQNNNKIVLLAIENDALAYCHASDRLQSDQDVLIKALKKDLEILHEMPSELFYHNEHIAYLVALKQSCYLKYFSEDIAKDALQAASLCLALEPEVEKNDQPSMSLSSSLNSQISSHILPLLFSDRSSLDNQAQKSLEQLIEHQVQKTYKIR